MSSPDSSTELAVACSPLGDSLAARSLAEELALPFLGTVRPRDIRDYPVLLYSDEHGLGLQVTGKGAPGPVRAEFVTGKAGYRRDHGGGTGQLIAKAVGLKKARQPLHVLDATAGLGQDAFVLASLGCRVTLFERSPIIHALLSDGLARAALNEQSASLVARMALQPGNSIDWLQKAAQIAEADTADVIYLDPMFPHRDKSALVKKEMQVFRTVVGDDDDSAELLAAALQVATYRVVVKRPRKAEPVGGPEPTTRVEGKSSRYDVYSIKALPSG
ncbi:class I SAM-dependent methyltransferase [Marinobacter sp. TBZ242]|uniref:Ribosomal RNA small subunit methyltransferase J n=1 Tax=Marinobacter azerbaijanicus TaxID=3050455 RepID=A0ABT7I8R4_9GAMM|nr:class I SAM-dependent methyltransferase [Marinobacter sp. TBZ242]MDL0430532.1 class I SAM-dependent methyltransferase [Marinobacter sp. TBZ242]